MIEKGGQADSRTGGRTRAAFLLLLAALGCKDSRSETGFVPLADASSQTTERNSALDTSRRTAIVDAATRVGPAVVSINATSRRRVSSPSMFDMFFVPQGREQLVPVSGTGFIVRPNGTIITNQPVVAGAERVVVTLSDGTDLPARVLGEDPVTDIAVLNTAPALTEPVVDAVRQWRFSPARLEGTPVAARMTVAVYVALQRNVAPGPGQ